MPVNRKSLANLVNIQLQSGVTSEVHRIRAPEGVQAWFKAMTAEERGDLLARVMAGTAPKSKPAPKAAAPASLDGLSYLRVVSSTIPNSLRNELRWPPESYRKLEESLSRESVLTLATIRGKAAWRLSTGESIRKDTVTRLFTAGLLANTADP